MLLIALLFVSYFGPLGVPAAALLFVSVLVHELGHAVVAQRYGIPISAIHLHLLGGTAMMSRSPTDPKQELKISIAGPLVSLTLGVLGLIACAVSPFQTSEIGAIATAADLIPYFTGANLALGLFNLVPAIPMDGGRMLRALLTNRMGHYRATRLAARISRVASVAFVLLGLYQGAWTLALIGIGVWFLASREERVAYIEELSRSRQSFDPLSRVWTIIPTMGPDRVARSWDRFDRDRWGDQPVD
jgi:Zn-dependent protease